MDIQYSSSANVAARQSGPKIPTRETREFPACAGLEVLTEKGSAATGIDEVLKRVGVPEGFLLSLLPIASGSQLR